MRLPLVSVIALIVVAVAACGTAPSTSGEDLASPRDQAVASVVDMSLSPPDTAAPSDFSQATDGNAGIVVCNLGNDPLPCMQNAACTASGAVCDQARKYCVCSTPNCTPGQDQTCNDDIRISSFHGHCNAAGSCQCMNGIMKSAATGKCL